MKAHKNEVNMKPQYETRLALLEQSNIHFNDTLKRIDNNIVSLHQNIAEVVHTINQRIDALSDKMDKKFDAVDKKFEAIDKKFDQINTKIDNNFKYAITTMLGLFVASGLMPAIAAALQKLIH